jgi:magnesium chelatase accessory protein
MRLKANRYEPLDWARDGPTWPHHAHSHFIDVGPLRWHVQRFAACRRANAPLALLLHGTGSSAHSWRALAPLLAERYELLVPDLPGHAFTCTPAAQPLSLPGMAQAVAALLEAQQLRPALVIGHSAGAAIGVQLCLEGHVAPAALVSINGALLPLHGLAGRVFSPLARLLAAQPIVPRLFAWRAAKPAVLQRLLDSTGSKLDAEGQRLYSRLVADATHAAGALRMMAEWDLQPLVQALPRLKLPLHLLAGKRDLTVPPAHSQRVQSLVPGAVFHALPGLGHLAHEEDAAAVMAAMAAALA